MTDINNRRISVRRLPKVSVRVLCRKGGFDMGPDVAISLLDVSEEGAQLVLKQLLLANQEVTVGLQGQNHRVPVSHVGTVVWSVPVEGGCCVGIRFEKRLPYRDLLALVTI
jgi:PilZ domain